MNVQTLFFMCANLDKYSAFRVIDFQMGTENDVYFDGPWTRMPEELKTKNVRCFHIKERNEFDVPQITVYIDK